MRSVIWLFALAPALLAFNAASAQSGPPPAGEAAHWCGFLDKAGAQVRCGFVSQQDCEKALGDAKDAVCMPDPAFALNGRFTQVKIGG
jgi:hypothetical protein